MSNAKKFEWSAASAGRKLVSGLTVTVSTPTPIVSVSKSIPLTPEHDATKDAYRNCKNCGKHINYHKDGKCPT